MTPDIIDTIEKLENFAAEWGELWDSDPVATPFHSPFWLLPWTRNLWGGGRLIILAFHRNGRLIGVAPLFKWGEDRISWLGSGITDYLGITAVPEHRAEVAQALLGALSQMDWEICDLQEQNADSPLLDASPPPGLCARIDDCSICPVVDVGPQWSCPSRLRAHFRQAEARLRAAGEIRFERGDPDELMPVFFRLHNARRNGHGMVSTQVLQRFHTEVISPLTRMYCLRVNGEPIAVQYCLDGKGRSCLYLSGFDPAWSAFSPGALLLRYSIESAIAEGATAADFLRNPEPYKYRWGARDRPNWKVTLIREDR